MFRATAALSAFASSALAISFIAASGGSALGQPPVPIPEPHTTLGRFLGIPQALGGTYDSLVNRRGNLPGLERRGRGARVRRIADPAFLHPEAPPLLKTAAQIKMQEDLAPQKVKALKYLGSIGCGCYDKDGEVTAALLEGLKDCTLEVRLAAVEVIAEAAAGEYCQFCSERSCCKPLLAEKLDEMANGQDETGCWLEPSAEVRAAAAQALATCGPIIVETEPLPPVDQRGPEDLPDTPPPTNGVAPPTPEPLTRTPARTVPATTTPARTAPATRPVAERQTPLRSSRRETPGARTARNQLQPTPAKQVAGATLTVATDESEDLFDLFQPEESAASAANISPGAFQTSSHIRPISTQTVVQERSARAPVSSGRPGESRSRPASKRPATQRGVVEAVDESRGVVRVRFDHEGSVPVGSPVAISHETLIGGFTVSGQVDRWESGHAIVRPFDTHAVSRLARGDEATLYVPRPKVYR